MAKLFSLDAGWKYVLQKLEVDSRSLLKLAELPGDLLNRVNPRVSVVQFIALWRALEQLSDKDELALILGQALSGNDFTPSLFTALCCDNLGDAFKRLQAFKPLVGPLAINILETERGVKYHYSCSSGDLLPDSYLLVESVFLIHLARMATKERVVPARVKTPLAESSGNLYQQYFGVELTMGASTEIEFTRQDIAKPVMSEAMPMWDFFEQREPVRPDGLGQQRSIQNKVTQILSRHIPAGKPDIDSVAEALSVSRRTLQRKLNEEEISFQQLLGRVREKLAHHYLIKTRLPSEQIAFMLGFDDPNSFIRAFTQWRGISPEMLRKQQTTESGFCG